MELIKDGIRLDGRKPDELREVKITAGVLDNADGSCYLEWGNNKIYAGTLTSVPGTVIPIEPVLLFFLLLKVIPAVVAVIPYAS